MRHILETSQHRPNFYKKSGVCWGRAAEFCSLRQIGAAGGRAQSIRLLATDALIRALSSPISCENPSSVPALAGSSVCASLKPQMGYPLRSALGASWHNTLIAFFWRLYRRSYKAGLLGPACTRTKAHSKAKTPFLSLTQRGRALKRFCFFKPTFSVKLWVALLQLVF